jgi:hypothetical protein
MKYGFLESNMSIESLTTHVLQGVFLALTPSERWSAAKSPAGGSLTTEQWLTLFAVLAQIVSLAVVFWLVAKKKRLEHKRKQEISRFSDTSEELRQKIDELSQQVETLTSEQMTPSVLEESEDPVAIRHKLSGDAGDQSPGID